MDIQDVMERVRGDYQRYADFRSSQHGDCEDRRTSMEVVEVIDFLLEQQARLEEKKSNV